MRDDDGMRGLGGASYLDEFLLPILVRRHKGGVPSSEDCEVDHLDPRGEVLYERREANAIATRADYYIRMPAP